MRVWVDGKRIQTDGNGHIRDVEIRLSMTAEQFGLASCKCTIDGSTKEIVHTYKDVWLDPETEILFRTFRSISE